MKENMTGHAAESMSEHVKEPVPEHVTEPVPEHVTEPVPEHMAEHVAEPVPEHAAEPYRDRLQELEEENKKLKKDIQVREDFIRDAVGAYLPPEVLEEIILKKKGFRIGGERRVVTILFSDLRHSTELSEKMDPVSFIRMLNHFLVEMIEIINAWQGNILDFVGDSIVAVFGAPRPNELSARDATACAVAMQRRMKAVNEWNLSEGYPEISMGIGIHTGEAILGNIGSATRAKYDMIGRNVNLAFRIQSYTKSGQILISSETLAAAGDLVLENEERAIIVRPKGILKNVRLHDIIGYGGQHLSPTEAYD